MDRDEDTNNVEGYDCTDLMNEPRPDSVVYQDQFVQLKEKCNEATKLLLTPLKESEYQNKITNGLLVEVENRTKIETSEEAMFAISGDMAAGMNFTSCSILSWC